MNIFETATRNKLRFASDKGDLTTEQLWDLPLTSLDKIARSVNTELKSVTEESFVVTTPDPRKSTYTLQLDILKHVIAVRLEENDKAKKAAERAERRKKLLEALDAKEDEELGKKSRSQLLKELEELE